jgi:DmsE family decaheme c-type cytochrome
MKRLILLSLGAGALALLVAGGGPPPRAEAGPAEDCAVCHEETVAEFRSNAHARLISGDWFGLAQACASCHEGAHEHAKEGDPELVRTFPGENRAEDAELCLGCHASASGMGAWPAGEHALAGVSCADCHEVHGDPRQLGHTVLGARPVDLQERCYDCHPEVRAQVRMPSRHPISEGHMTCAACHDPHGANPGLLATPNRVNDLCVDCHPAQHGPFVFQHEPVEESCLLCHQPHGAVADKLLAQTEPFLCLQCHEAHFHAGLESPEDTTPTFGTIEPNTWENPFGEFGMKRAFLTRCTQCHQSVHGSDLSSQGVSGQGRNLTR